MIKASGAEADGTPFVLLGLSEENCRRLVAGQPIRVRANDVDPRLPAISVLLVGGATEDSIAADLVDAEPILARHHPVTVLAGSITCPRCEFTSHNANDVREGYCGRCRDWTSERRST